MMNMPIADINRRQVQSFSSAQIMPFVAKQAPTPFDVFDRSLNAHGLLDQHFPLQTGSHKNVTQYVIYFRHLMAFFADGTHCGLTESKQFVAFVGHKERPESIVLKKGDTHIELLPSQAGSAITIEYPSKERFTSANGDDYFVE